MPPSLLTELSYRPDSASLFEAIADRPWAVFLDSGAHHPAQSRYDLFSAQPYVRLVTRGGLTEIHSDTVLLTRDDPFTVVRQYLEIDPACGNTLPFCGGAIGYLGYDLARRIEKLPSIAHDAERIPDMVIGIYDWAVVVDHVERRTWLVGQGRDPETDLKWDALVTLFSNPPPERTRTPFRVTSSVVSNMTRETYSRAFDSIRHYIAEGDCYQVNLAQRFSAQAAGDPWLAYQALRVLNPAPYAAYLNTPYAHVLSASPERFVQVRDGRVEAKPIKGTRPRAGHARLDVELIEALRASAKDRAENVMIVDLLRNDLSKSCRLGSVQVPKLFDVESFATVHHLVSTVTGELRADRDAIDLLRGAFPGGSITGAPKLRAMQIIEELEPHRRGVYCGAIGYLGFDGNMDMNIAIRTAVYTRGEIRFWAGGGIIADSKCEEEYQETFDKAAAMLKLMQQFAVSQASA
ncbi:MAG: aminodeoxychorismate synthase component I [Pseudomonadota bacterium]